MECDFAFTHNYGKFFREYAHVPTFAMTGYITQEKYTTFKDVLPLLVHIPIDTLQQGEVLNETIFKFVQIPLSKEINRVIKYKDKVGVEKTFVTSENDQYKYFRKKEDATISKMMAAIAKGDTAEVNNCEKILQEVIPRERAAFLFGLTSTVEVTKILIQKILQADSKNKVITFSERTDNADLISENSYHGKTPKKEAEERFENFKRGHIRVLSTCSKVNRGVNIPELNYAIMESFNSDTTSMMQKNGRLCRLGSDEIGIIYFILPYYWENDTEVRPTRVIFWARKLMEKFPNTKIEVLNYCGNVKILKA